MNHNITTWADGDSLGYICSACEHIEVAVDELDRDVRIVLHIASDAQ